MVVMQVKAGVVFVRADYAGVREGDVCHLA